MNSQLVVLALVVLCGALSVNGSAATAYIQSKSDQSLIKALMQSRAAPTSGSEQMACFDHYNPLINEISETFKKDYQTCLDNAKAQTDALNELGTESRDDITKASNEVCNQFQVCQSAANNLDFFDCYSNLGDASVRQVYVNSQNATISASDYRETIRTIQVESERCENRTEAAFVENTANMYDKLTDCLRYGINWSTDAPTTDAPATDAPATDAPTTDAPATDAPATDAPTTDAPATDAPATDAPTTDAPATDAPATDAPATDAPATDAPATDAPATDAPATDAPSNEGTTEADQVEELEQNDVRSRLQQLVSSWGKRFA